MYRYSVDNAVTYTPEDLVLFKESPFASFMERLTLENPSHGIPPDIGSEPPRDTTQRQDEIVETLRAEDRNVSLIEWDMDEPTRRNATLEAMRHGVDFIVNGQLALGTLSGAANLLMRTSGYSELGSFLYIPCDTQAKTTLQSAFRLCFLADILHSLQGQLPPQMLIIRGGSDVVPLQTEDHIYHYQAVKQRFMNAQREFRKHRMPDPAESSQFGRWSDCANEVMKQRLLSPQQDSTDDGLEQPHEAQAEQVVPLAQAVGSVLDTAASVEEGHGGVGANPADASIAPAADPVAFAETPSVPEPTAGGSPSPAYNKGIPVSDTLAAQARSLSRSVDDSVESSVPDVPPPVEPLAEPTPALTPAPTNTGSYASDRTTASATDAALMDLQFIGSSVRRPDADASRAPGGVDRRRSRQEPPAPALGASADAYRAETMEQASQEKEGASPSPDQAHPLDSPGFNVNQRSIVDRDELPPLTPKTPPSAKLQPSKDEPDVPPFSSSLITNDGSLDED